MNEPVIMIPTDAATAARYVAASDEQRLKIELLVRLLLLERPRPSPDSLLQLMDAMSAEAQANGLTPEILEASLNDPDEA